MLATRFWMATRLNGVEGVVERPPVAAHGALEAGLSLGAGLIHLESAQSHSRRRGEQAGSRYAGRLEPAQADSNVIKASIATLFPTCARYRTLGSRLKLSIGSTPISQGDPALG